MNKWAGNSIILFPSFVKLQVFGDEADMYKLEDVQMNDFGTVKEVTVTKDDTLMMKVRNCSLALSLPLSLSLLDFSKLNQYYLDWKEMKQFFSYLIMHENSVEKSKKNSNKHCDLWKKYFSS